MAMFKVSCLVFLFCFVLFQASKIVAVYNVNVVNYGAKPNGKTDSTQAFLKSWALACSSKVPASIYVPHGTFLLRSIKFSGPCRSKISIWIHGTIVAPSNYWLIGNSGYWILFYKVRRVTINGGTIDANGASYWACRQAGRNCPPGARSISFVGCNKFVVNKLVSKNSQGFNVAIDQSHEIRLKNLIISAPSWSPNTDGIHMQSSVGVSIIKSTIRTGDDCISIGPGSQNVWIQQIVCGPGHGISIGSLAEHKNEDGVQNVTVTGATFTGTQNGVRIKSWGRPSTGFARNINFRNIIMDYVFNPIIIDQFYCPGGHNCPRHSSGVKISGVTYENIKGTSATEVAMNFACSASNPCTGLRLNNIKLTYSKRGMAKSSCVNAHGRSGRDVIPRACF